VLKPARTSAAQSKTMTRYNGFVASIATVSDAAIHTSQARALNTRLPQSFQVSLRAAEGGEAISTLQYWDCALVTAPSACGLLAMTIYRI